MSRKLKVPHLATYEIGYKKPPKSTQFEKGQSGNPKGRPKGSKNKGNEDMLKLQNIILEEAFRELPIQEKDERQSMTTIQAAVRSLAVNAARGNIAAQKLFISITDNAENEKLHRTIDGFVVAIEYQAEARELIKEAAAQGRDINDKILPHPDHVDADIKTGKVSINGPINESEKKLWDRLWARKRRWDDKLNEIENIEEKQGASDDIAYDIARVNYFLSKLEQGIITHWNRPPEEVIEDPIRRQEAINRIEKGELPKRPIPPS